MKHRYYGKASEWDQYEFRRLSELRRGDVGGSDWADGITFWVCAVLLALLLLGPAAALL